MSSKTKSDVPDVSMLSRGGSPGLTIKRMCWRCQKSKLLQGGAKVIRGLWHCGECANQLKEKK